MLRIGMTLVILVGLTWGSSIQQPRQDVLGTCLSDQTTGRDRKDLVKWIFLAMAQHPDMKGLLTTSAATEAAESNKKIGALVTRLLAESCTNEARQAAGVGGSAFEAAFEKLGQVAMQELMLDDSVTAAIGGFEPFMDMARLKKIFGGE
jgi:hypothetical protein